MKRFVSIFLSLILLISFCPMFFTEADAVSLDAGTSALREQFLDGICTDNNMDYVSFSPVKDENDESLYPLVIWLHGRSSGDTQREQLDKYNICFWSSEEYQSRFVSGGAFMLLPRSNGYNNNWFDTMTVTLKQTIDYYIQLNKEHIDTSKIYILGYSSGGSMVNYMLNAYPEFFAAAIPMCSVYLPTSVELDKLKDTSVWYFACTQDPYAGANASSVQVNFDYLSSITNRPQGVRMTTITNAVWADGSQTTEDWQYQHYIFDAVINDMHMSNGDPYAYATTKDATGATISFDQPGGLISWLSEQVIEEEKVENSFFRKIIDFFKGIFKYLLEIFI